MLQSAIRSTLKHDDSLGTNVSRTHLTRLLRWEAVYDILQRSRRNLDRIVSTLVNCFGELTAGLLGLARRSGIRLAFELALVVVLGVVSGLGSADAQKFLKSSIKQGQT